MDIARFSDREAHGVVEVLRGATALDALDTRGFWVVVMTFEGELTAVRFEDVRRGVPSPPRGVAWARLEGPWRSSLERTAYLDAVREVRRRIADGEVYQANICRVLRHRIDEGSDLDGLDAVLREGNPAPHAARVRVAEAGIDLVSASPELFLGRSGVRLVSEPIKGTARTGRGMLAKDYAENVMIVDLVRNDLSHVCEPGSVDVEVLCAPVAHPGLVHLVSRVAGRLRPRTRWADVVAASFPPGSVSGAPKSSALRTIRDLEPTARGPYCGAVGWVDAESGTAELAVGIRTFWAEHDSDPAGGSARWLCFGTGAGITWGSDPEGEWEETELKAARLVGLACGAEVSARV